MTAVGVDGACLTGVIPDAQRQGIHCAMNPKHIPDK